MARATRVDFPGAWYHVLNRGTERRAIFRSTRCCEKFIELLSSLPERFGVRLHGYALMGNHYHLQLESREANLSKAVHWLNVSYSVWFNRKYSRVGPLFPGRFKAILHQLVPGSVTPKRRTGRAMRGAWPCSTPRFPASQRKWQPRRRYSDRFP
jgi:REP element-mobilizing transposase RayT